MSVFCFDVPPLTHVCWVWACFYFEGSSVFSCGLDGIKPCVQAHWPWRVGKTLGALGHKGAGGSFLQGLLHFWTHLTLSFSGQCWHLFCSAPQPLESQCSFKASTQVNLYKYKNLQLFSQTPDQLGSSVDVGLAEEQQCVRLKRLPQTVLTDYSASPRESGWSLMLPSRHKHLNTRLDINVVW